MPQRIAIASGMLIAGVIGVLAFYRYDALHAFGGPAGLTCEGLGVPRRLCLTIARGSVPLTVFFSTAIVAIIFGLGLYDPRPLIERIEQNRRPWWWLAVYAAGILTFSSPYLLAAAGVPLGAFVRLTPWLLVFGAVISASGLLFWLSGPRQLQGVLGPHHAAIIVAIVIIPFATQELEPLAWGGSLLQDATLRTAALFLTSIGQPVAMSPSDSLLGIGGFTVIVDHQCSGMSGVALVSAVMGGYVLMLRRQLRVGRALLLIPAGAAMSWVLNGVRLAALVLVGAYVSPDLALNGFHSYTGWLFFSVLSALLLFAAEGVSWIHLESKLADGKAEPAAIPVTRDPAAAQIVPFIVLLVSSLLTGAFFLEPEAGYPLRFALMATALLAFRKAYSFEIGRPDTIAILAGLCVAAVWLGVKTGGSPLGVRDILGDAGQGSIALWITLRIAGTAILVPIVEELFFRGYLLNLLNFGGMQGKAVALVLTSALFGALHEDVWLAGASGLVFGILALRAGRVSPAIAAHAAANGGIAAWAVWTGDWSVIG